MVSELAQCLQRYYRRERNRVVFRNGLTLNRLASELYTRLGGRSIDTSVLSRCITGRRLFNTEQLQAFCELMDISLEESAELEAALLRDRVRQHSLRSNSHQPVFLDMFKGSLEQIQRVRTSGYPKLAVDLANTSIRWFSMLERMVQPGERRELHLLLARIFLEKGIALREYLPVNEVAYASGLISVKLRSSARLCLDKELEALADFSYGDAWYIAAYSVGMRAYEKSAVYLERALDTLEDPDYRLWALRGLLLDYAYLGNLRAFQQTVDQVRRIIQEVNYKELNMVCAVEEGIARAHGVLGLQEGAEESLKRATLAYSLLEKAHNGELPFRRIQLVRTSLEVVDKFRSQGYVIAPQDELEASVGVARWIACERGYDRHAIYLEALSEKLGLGVTFPR